MPTIVGGHLLNYKNKNIVKRITFIVLVITIYLIMLNLVLKKQAEGFNIISGIITIPFPKLTNLFVPKT